MQSFRMQQRVAGAAGAPRALLAARPVVPKRMVAAQNGAPKTGQHTVEEALRDEALALFFDKPAKTRPTTGGVNNVVQYVDTEDGQTYILRIYNNGNKTEKVQCEHEILVALQSQPLSFKVPKPLPALGDGATYKLLSSGAAACVFEVIPGTLAKTTSPEEVGRATGELCTAMGNISISRPPAIPPYFELFKVHHAIGGDAEVFYRDVATNPAFNACREAIDYLVAEIKAIMPTIERYAQRGLPMQLIHGDLHYDNVMVLGDSVSGLLDFEFCAYDWRLMELAVALSKYVSEDEPLPLIERFASGYAAHGKLTAEEIELIPDAINLRIFSNAVYFTGRALAGEDGIDSLTSRAGAYAKRVRWVNANKAAIIDAIKAKMLAPARVAA